MLTNQLVEPIFCHYAVSICIGVQAMIGARGPAIDGNPETYRLSVRAWA
jgi:hypothetical protein